VLRAVNIEREAPASESNDYEPPAIVRREPIEALLFKVKSDFVVC